MQCSSTPTPLLGKKAGDRFTAFRKRFICVGTPVMTDPYNARVPVAESKNLLVLGREQRVRLVHEPNAVSDDPHPSSEKEGS
jgi:hypothetical protein